MKRIRATLINSREESAARVSELSGQASGPHLELLNHVGSSGHDALIVIDRAAHRLLAADAIERNTERPLALAYAVEAVDDVEARHVERHALNAFLHDGQLHDGVALHYLSAGGSLGFEQRRGGIDLHRLGCIAYFHSLID